MAKRPGRIIKNLLLSVVALVFLALAVLVISAFVAGGAPSQNISVSIGGVLFGILMLGLLAIGLLLLIDMYQSDSDDLLNEIYGAGGKTGSYTKLGRYKRIRLRPGHHRIMPDPPEHD